MERTQYQALEAYMRRCMTDSAHDQAHVYRVLYLALDIARQETGVDHDILISACLLHDIGRKEQIEDPTLCHARVGSEKAYAYLLSQGWTEAAAVQVRDCILTHRFRAEQPPVSLEAKILFDADKLDVTGALGVARSLLYIGRAEQPLYTTGPDGQVLDGSGREPPSFFREYHFKLKKLYGAFYTQRAHELAQSRRLAAESFYQELLQQVRGPGEAGPQLLAEFLH